MVAVVVGVLSVCVCVVDQHHCQTLAEGQRYQIKKFSSAPPKGGGGDYDVVMFGGGCGGGGYRFGLVAFGRECNVQIVVCHTPLPRDFVEIEECS